MNIYNKDATCLAHITFSKLFVYKDLSSVILNYDHRNGVLVSSISTNDLGSFKVKDPEWKVIKKELKYADFSDYRINKIKDLIGF